MDAAIRKVKRFLQEDQGPTAVEYAVLLGLIMMVIIGSVTAFGLKVTEMFTDTTQTIALASESG
ncbi:MAG: Flp family type IVb pilin [Candidatus Omnitrophica bacterium]|nr:Flp family type IVb pilin [Candidatus Omnitrophota bacterium]